MYTLYQSAQKLKIILFLNDKYFKDDAVLNKIHNSYKK